MKNILSSYGGNKKYLSWIAWFTVGFILVLSFKRFPLSSGAVGDENGYSAEVDYFARYGMYHALSQGTSFVYSLLIFVFSKIFSTDYLVSARILTVLAFVVCCILMLKCFDRFAGVGSEERYFGLVYFATVCLLWLWKGLPDLVSIAFLLAGFYLVLASKKNWYLLLAGVIVFLGFAVKPVVLFAVPGLVVFILFQNFDKAAWSGNVVRTMLFLVGFGVCFVVYHIPGYQAFHKLMLEDKNHTYDGMKRVEYPITWNEKNNYFELYNVHNRVNKWAVSFEEVDSFERQHPEINLKTGYADYLQNHFGNWVKGASMKIFLDLPFRAQHGFFFAKWTLVNKIVKNLFIIKLLSLILMAGMAFAERDFIRTNVLCLLVPFLFYVLLSLYTIPQLEDNWLLFCLPFIALPVVKFLTKRINIMLLLALQFIYLLI